MAPMIVFGIFGVIAQTAKGLVVAAYLVSLIAMLFTAYSYGQMVKAFPTAGSAYTYVRKAINAHLGFLVGWAILLDYIFIPMAIWLIGASYLTAMFPVIPTWAWILLFIVITTLINIIGIQVATGVNFLMMAFQFLVIAFFIILSIKSLLGGTGAGALWSVKLFTGDGQSSLSAVFAGASIACYSYLGFDAITTLTEETVHPEKTMPRAILLTTLIGGVIFIAASYFAQLVHPDYLHFNDISSAGLEIAKEIGGNIFGAFFLSGLIIAQFASGLSAQASASRLIYAMGRDGVFPKKIFGYLNKKFRTPMFNIVLIGMISLLALTMTVATSTSFINFGAFSAFTFVNIAVFTHYFIRERNRGPAAFWKFLFCPLAGACCTLWLLFHLDHAALILGISWLIIGFVYLLFLTNLFKKEPPELSLGENKEDYPHPLAN
ncbi:APC family permease [Sporolactobacillus sp. THM7-7]|nr:APC family permease [Sporolactobacillus sp. THM7-7]